jgi:hypothetical protein
MKKLAVLSLVLVLVLLGARDSSASMPQSLEDWCVTRMSSWSPPGKSMYKDARESEADGLARYKEIARDAISVVYDPSEAPLFPGPYGRAKTLATMLGIADSESGFRKDVDEGKGSASKGDGGKSWCLMQVQLGQAVNGKTPIRIGPKGDTFEYIYDKKSGWGGEDLVSDHKACFKAALRIMRSSFNACGPLPVEEKLTVYTSGNCTDGRASSRIRVGKAIRWLAASAPPMNDVDVLALMSAPAQSSTVALNP